MKKRLPRIYKANVNTPISNKHFGEFGRRFIIENKKVLDEAREEMDRIKQKRKAIFMKRLTKQRMGNLFTQDQKDEYYRRRKFIQDLST